MVKRTLAVLGILSLLVVAAGSTSMVNAQCCSADMSWVCNWPSNCGTACFVPVDVQTPEWTRIVKTWSIKIDGPCPAPGPMVGCGTTRGINTGICAGVNALFSPLDCIFGGGGVYNCSPNLGGGDGPCGPAFGPIPALLTAVPRLLAGPPIVFGTLW